MEAPSVLSFAASLWRDPSQIVNAWEAPGFALAPRVAVYVHFDAQGHVARSVLHAMRALRDEGFSVLFVSNAGKLVPAAVQAVRQIADGMLVRRNIGYDFGAMREGLMHWQLPRDTTEMVLLTNDSVLGPFAPLAPMLSRLDFAAADLWSAADSLQRRYHLQSWWVAVGRRALLHPAWQAFWAGVRPVRSKEWVIAHYELGFTRDLQRAGLRAQALFPYRSLLTLADQPAHAATDLQVRQRAKRRRLLSRGLTLNPTADLWRELFMSGCPFIKRELVGRNPARVIDAGEWRTLVPDATLRSLGL